MIFCSLMTPEAKSPMHTITIGVDLAKLAFSACAVDERGAVTQRRDLRCGKIQLADALEVDMPASNPQVVVVLHS